MVERTIEPTDHSTTVRLRWHSESSFVVVIQLRMFKIPAADDDGQIVPSLRP